MSIYRIDPLAGSDTNVGTSIYFPFKTVAPVNALIAAGKIGRGDLVVAAGRGDVHIPGGIKAATPVALRGTTRLVFDQWGDSMPVFDLYKIANDPASWTPHAAGVWKANITAGAPGITGNSSEPSTNVAHLYVDGQLKGHRSVYTIGELGNQRLWSYACDATYAYVRADGNPASITDDLRISVNCNGIEPGVNTTFTNLEIVGAGGMGVSAIERNDWSTVGLVLRRIGGAEHGPGTRAGNAWQAYISGSRIAVLNNYAEDVFDVGWTAQGKSYPGGSNGWQDVEVAGNTIVRAAQGFEHWFNTEQGGTLVGYQRVNIHDNTVYFAGYSWGADYKSADILSYDFDPVPGGHDLNIFDNTFVGATRHVFARRFGNTNYSVPEGLNLYRNVIALAPGGEIAYEQPQKLEQAAEWVQAQGAEDSSVWLPLAADVLAVPQKDRLAAMQAFVAARTATVDSRLSALERQHGSTAGKVASVTGQIESLRADGNQSGSLLAGRLYMPGASTRTTLVAASAVDRFRGLEWVAPASGLIDQVSISVTTAGSSSATFYVMVLRYEGDKLVPHFASAAVDCSTTGTKSLAANFRVREGQRFYVGGVVPSGPATLPVIRAGTALGRTPFLGFRSTDIDTMLSSATYTTGIEVNGFTLPFNSTFAPGGLTDVAPLVVMRAA
ncbi:hypothetical protein ASF48_04865 [Rathayibacter sp. Leaf299]|uniref:hypothetical protein n=1 Tax=Rathayibacter sp. Leaf299 TaxID=1736328 RepID=UPI0006FEEED3|nr:hypothetical protein [Rathayibacter sp. Leaf299]KQQ22517.1 hypothetical protein ASF48_04865 [Rathayibacter sp. Leaf299]